MESVHGEDHGREVDGVVSFVGVRWGGRSFVDSFCDGVSQGGFAAARSAGDADE